MCHRIKMLNVTQAEEFDSLQSNSRDVTLKEGDMIEGTINETSEHNLNLKKKQTAECIATDDYSWAL